MSHVPEFHDDNLDCEEREACYDLVSSCPQCGDHLRLENLVKEIPEDNSLKWCEDMLEIWESSSA